MATALNLLLHVLLVSTLLLLVGAIVKLVVAEPHPIERMARVLALVAGAMVALGAQVTGDGFANYTIDALVGVRPAGAVVEPLAVLLPGGIGVALGWYFIRVLNKSVVKGMRWVVFFGMLAAVAFTAVYAAATSTEGVMLGVAALPNASFISGIALTILVFLPEPGASDEKSASKLSALKRLFGRTSRRSPAAAGATAGLVRDEPASVSNPFARD